MTIGIRSSVLPIFLTSLLTSGCGSSVCPPGTFPNAEDDELAIAAASGRVGRVQTLVREGGDTNAVGAGGVTPLICAGMTREFAAFAALLELGADPNVQSESGISGLSLAVATSDQKYLQSALVHGANPNARTKERPILFNALTPGRLPQVRLLVGAGADVNASDELGQTPMLLAVSLELYEVGLYLFQHGADPTIEDRIGRSALQSVATRQPIAETPEATDRQLLIAALRTAGYDVAVIADPPLQSAPLRSVR